MVPAELLEIFGPPALLSTEDPRLYAKLLARAGQDIRPTDIIGWILVKRFIDQFVECERYRRSTTGWMQDVAQRKTGGQIAALEASKSSESPHPLRQSILAFRRESQRLRAARGLVSQENEEGNVDQQEMEEQRQEAERCARIQREIDELKANRMTENDLVIALPACIKELEALEALLRAKEVQLSATRREIDDHLHGLGRALRESFDQIIEGEIIEPEAHAAPQVQPAMPVRRSPVRSLTRRPRTPLTPKPLRLASKPREKNRARARRAR
jgi:hypothetical protein